MLDEHGQPEERAFNWKRLRDSRIDELIGLCRGVLADGVLVFEEAKFILDWLRRNPQVLKSEVGRIIEPRLTAAVRDGVLSSDEEEELVTLILQLVGGRPTTDRSASLSTSLPLDQPVPTIVFPGAIHCLTGKFTFGTRSQCEDAVIKLGGSVCSTPSKKTSFLVIGEIGRRDWIHSAMGRKIEKAVEIKRKGAAIRIVSEQAWAEVVKRSSISGVT